VKACTAKPRSASSYFGTFQEFLTAQRERQQRQLEVLFATLSKEETERLRVTLADELRDLALHFPPCM
jgi:hypothetical protein